MLLFEILIYLGIPVGVAFLWLNPQFGGRMTREHNLRYSKSQHWKKNKFENLSPTKIDITPAKMPGLLKQQRAARKIKQPKVTLPVTPFDLSAFERDPEIPKFIWYGHSVLLLRIAGKTILIDPMFGPDASPPAPISTRRFSDNTIDFISQFPKIDLVLYTHDHYDHIDLKSVRLLKDKVDQWWVGLGIGRHLERWKIELSQITEFDWWEESFLENIRITYTPSRHFGGRGPFDRAKSLWGGWTIQSESHSIYWTGDGGYDSTFTEIGQKFGPFDWVFSECGQYNDLWRQIHMHPEESVQAGVDAKGKVIIPVHWAGFALAMHHWKDPIQRFYAEAAKLNQNICTPQIGELVEMGKEPAPSEWWEEFE